MDLNLPPFDARLWVVVLSGCVSVFLIWRLWRSEEHLFFKVSLSVLGLLPVLGPLMMLWIGHFPSRVPAVFRDNGKYSSDVYEKWRHVHEEKDPVRRQEKWQTMVDQSDHPGR
ncbi:hypothetical protein ACVC7V_22945 [Hydrogenophaga sp. A37]|uniref:hypothetical protein n=1 Tax=Hydrogenophaga sp. A37 TaxID=1945864 RepID=UPI0009860EFB|nr:hypothetical protein [Hydrogenophaga sp. A37]OOG83156.1 hypothetical protein B0E41_13395 [Hydrogenophaga sp. A37]